MRYDSRNDPIDFLNEISRPPTGPLPRLVLTCPRCRVSGPAPNLPAGSAVRCINCRTAFITPGEPDPFDFIQGPPSRSSYPNKLHYREPHRGGMILIFGILGFFVYPLAIVAWVMGAADLNKMASGQMDPSGQSETQTGTTLGTISTILGSIGIIYAVYVWASLMHAIHAL